MFLMIGHDNINKKNEASFCLNIPESWRDETGHSCMSLGLKLLLGADTDRNTTAR